MLSLVYAGYGQVSAWVFNNEGNPVKYASVITLDNLKNGTTTGENGHFSFLQSLKAGVYISAVGFYDTIIPASVFRQQESKVILRTRIYELEEVSVKPDYSKPVVIGIPGIRPTSEDGWKRMSPGLQTGIFYETKQKDRYKEIASVEFYIADNGCYDALMGLRLLAYQARRAKKNQKILSDEISDLLPELIIFQAKKPGWIKIDLSAYDIVMPEEGLLVMVMAIEGGKKYQWKDKTGDSYYGAMIANNPRPYPAYKFAAADDQESKSAYYIVDSPLLRLSKPMIVINLK